MMERAEDVPTNNTDVFEEQSYVLSKSTLHFDVFNSRYYIWNKRLMCYVGHWPYQSFRAKCFSICFLTFLSYSLFIPQMSRCIILARPLDDIGAFIECFGPTLTNFGYTVKLINLIYNTKKIRHIFDEIRDDWAHMQRQTAELKILQKYGEHGRFYTLSYFILVNSVIAGWVTLPMVSVIMDHFMPLNETRPHLIIFPADYGVEDHDKYFYWISLHAGVVCVLGMQMFVANETLFMIMSKHACAMLAVLRYRLELIPRENAEFTSVPKSEHDDAMDYQIIVSCIRRHNRVIKFIRLIESSCEWSLVGVIALNVIVLSGTGSQIVAQGTPLRDVIRFTFFALAQLVHLFCSTLPGHWILASSSMIRDSAYGCRWYLLSTRSKKLLMLLMRRCLEPCTITAGKLYVMSMQNFCSVLQTTMSYFTMLTSTQ